MDEWMGFYQDIAQIYEFSADRTAIAFRLFSIDHEP